MASLQRASNQLQIQPGYRAVLERNLKDHEKERGLQKAKDHAAAPALLGGEPVEDSREHADADGNVPAR